MSAPLILAFDTSGPWVAAALIRGESLLAQRCEAIAKGQAERLMPLIAETIAEAGTALSGLDAIGVGIGPGNFTGIRISVAAARGLALALGIPAIGVSGFEALRGKASRRLAAAELVVLPAPRGGLYLQRFEAGQEAGPPHYLTDGSAPDWAALGVTAQTPLLGTSADLLSAQFPADAPDAHPAHRHAELPGTDLAPTIARIAADKRAAGAPLPRPAPLYIRPADAAPARHGPPSIL